MVVRRVTITSTIRNAGNETRFQLKAMTVMTVQITVLSCPELKSAKLEEDIRVIEVQ